MDRLAAAVGIDGWEMRSRNVVTPGSVWGPGQIMDEGCVGARVCLDAVKPTYDAARAAGRPVGIGLGLKNSGLGNGLREVAKAVVRFEPDGTVEVRHCWTEMGQGVHTVAQQVAVTELGVAAEKVRVVVDTTRELGAGQTTGSRGTLMGAGSVADACKAALADGCREGVDYEGSYIVDWTDSLRDDVENPKIHSCFGFACQLVELDPDSGKVSRVLAAHDVGKAVNPTLCEGQIEGSVHMGLGYALTEGFPSDADGRPLNATLRSLAIVRPKDMPPVDVKLVEVPQPDSPYGIKGVGEIGLVPTAGAVAGPCRNSRRAAGAASCRCAMTPTRRAVGRQRQRLGPGRAPRPSQVPSPARHPLTVPAAVIRRRPESSVRCPGRGRRWAVVPDRLANRSAADPRRPHPRLSGRLGPEPVRPMTSAYTTPGLVCSHHHLYSALARGMPAPPRTPHGFLEILELVWWRLDRALDLDLIHWSAMLGALECLEVGCTAVIDHHESPHAIEGSLSVIADACAEVGVRASCAYGVMIGTAPTELGEGC